MNAALLDLFHRYPHQTAAEALRALRQVLQQVALLGLWRAKFFEHAAFYGGTALRILYDLNRFSEDLDFSLISKDLSFDFQPYLEAIEKEALSFGITSTARKKKKTSHSAIQSAFLKTNTVELLLHTTLPRKELRHIHLQEQVKIRIEIDTDPPPEFDTEEHFLLTPIPFSVRAFSKPDLFAGKLHAVLCREWKTRVKGRDLWDFTWFVSKKIPVHLSHLEARMKQTGHYKGKTPLSQKTLVDALRKKIESLDLEKAKDDLLPFIKDPTLLDVWSTSFFHSVTSQIKTTADR